ncbi:DUF2141 domain-containing protein [Croceibacterium xixiisoli]|uniref:DUF2141 domain-containing protein n=1 Tax=Croceibacterium xixiisoli TaxID=1476466 RepID=UPI0019275713|nr:DUF2141 domain-containing protein [Croceibacterium xixiisoli]
MTITIAGLRNDKGVVQYCAAPRGSAFPDCEGTGVISGSVPISGQSATITLPRLANGEWAIAVFHDRNANGELDTFAGIPREGYGFSRNPGFRPRAPRFDEAVIELAGNANIDIRMRYLF